MRPAPSAAVARAGAAVAGVRPGGSGCSSSEVGGQVGWLLPTACLLLVAGLFMALRGRLVGATAALVMWGGWLLVTAVTFSFMQGIFHAYYTVALAPAIAAIVGIGTVLLWRRRDHYPAALTMAVATAVATTTSFILLSRTPDFVPWLRWAILVVGAACAVLLLAVRQLPSSMRTGVAAVTLAAVLAGPTAYTLDTVRTAHSGSIPTAGPAVAGSFGPGGGGFPGGLHRSLAGGPPTGTGGAPGGFPGGGAGFPGGTTGIPGGATGMPGGLYRVTQGGAPGGGGGLLDGSTPSKALTTLLEKNAGAYTWVAATIGSNNASGYQLATQLPVMPIGGFNGSDPSPTLAQFKAYVTAGKIHYFITAGTGGGMSPGGGTSTAISRWVSSSFTSTTVGGVTLYDLSGGAK